MKLSYRLQAVAGLVDKGLRLADIGTDHGYIPIWLVQNGQIPSAIAMDVNPGPLIRAQEHIAAEHLESYIETRLSDGLAAIHTGEVDAIVIAGMGGGLTIRILEDGIDRLEAVKEMILQPQSDIEQVRRYLYQQGFEIIAEDAVLEDGKYYFPMKAVRIEQSVMSDTDYRFGKRLLKGRHPVLLSYLNRERDIYEMIDASLAVREYTEQIVTRRREVQEKLHMVELALKEMTA